MQRYGNLVDLEKCEKCAYSHYRRYPYSRERALESSRRNGGSLVAVAGVMGLESVDEEYNDIRHNLQTAIRMYKGGSFDTMQARQFVA